LHDTLANPAVITINTARWNYNGGSGHAQPPWPHGYNSGQMISFNTTGQLPAPLVIGKRYFIQHGTVTPTSFQISETSIFGNTGDKLFPMGPSVDTSVATNPGNTQSGVHSFTIYGESWAEVIMDPGLYYSTIHQFFQGYGLKKLKVRAYGAKMQSPFFGNGAFQDPNANTGGSGTPFSAQFQATNWGSGRPQNFVVLNDKGLINNLLVNGYVLLMACDMQGSEGQWSPQYSEYQKIVRLDPSMGTIYFYDYLRYNYKSTFPPYEFAGWLGTPTSPNGMFGPATIAQLPETYDQHVEYHG
jgi:hypothetical protein